MQMVKNSGETKEEVEVTKDKLASNFKRSERHASIQQFNETKVNNKSVSLEGQSIPHSNY